MDLTAIRTRLATTVANGVSPPPGVTLYTYRVLPRVQISQFPSFYVVPRRVQYGLTTMTEKTTTEIDGLLLCGPSNLDIERSQDLLDALIEPTGAASIRVALMADHVGGTPALWSAIHANEVEDYGFLTVWRNDYVGCRFPIRIHTV